MMLFAQTVLFFVVYAFFGWVWELCLSIAMRGKLHLHGFLTMPLLPIYGFSALGIIYLVQPYVHNPFLVFVVSMFVATVLELVVSLVLDKLFRLRLWDYSEWPMNYKGHVCAPAALAFGALGLLLAYVAHPWLTTVVDSLGSTMTIVLGWVLFGMVLIDFSNSFASLVRLRVDLAKLQGTLDDVQEAVDASVRELRAKRQKFKTGVVRWYRYNLRQLRKAFPGARVAKRRK